MKFSMRVDFRDLERGLSALPATVSKKVQVAALVEAAKPMRDQAAENAPYDVQGGAPHLQDNIAIGVVSEGALASRGRDTETVVEVGPELRPDDIFYGFFQEFGTAHHPANPFLRTAFDSTARESLEIIKDELWFGIKRGVDEF